MNFSHKLRPEHQGPSKVSSGDYNEFEVHDTFRSGFREVKQTLIPKHPLETQLEKWDDQQERLKLTMLRNVYGAHASIRRQMETTLISMHGRVPGMKSVSLAREILDNSLDTIDFSDYLNAPEYRVENCDFHTMMEKKLKL